MGALLWIEFGMSIVNSFSKLQLGCDTQKVCKGSCEVSQHDNFLVSKKI